MTDEEQKPHWSLDRRVPIAVIVALCFQAAAFVWFAATLNARVNALEANGVALAGITSRVIALETQTFYINQSFQGVNAGLNKLDEKMDKLLLTRQR